jgi:glucuronokinase
MRARFERGEKEVTRAMRYWASLADKVRRCLLAGEFGKISPLLNANFDRRRKVYRLGRENIQMIEAARAAGASAKFTGSGGAIVGTYRDDKMYDRLKRELRKLRIKVIKPKVVCSRGKR